MRLKKKEFEGKIGAKIIKEALRYFGYAFDKEEIDFYIFSKLKLLFDKYKNGVT